VYTNSLLATLNFRDTIRSNTKDINTFSLGAMNATGTDPAFSKASLSSPHISRQTHILVPTHPAPHGDQPRLGERAISGAHGE
jgi:hypothetical protein